MRIERLARSRKAMALGFVLALVIAGLLLTAKPAHAATTFTVNSTDDDGDQNTAVASCFTGQLVLVSGNLVPECTLRAAIEQANATAGVDTIDFGIPGSGPHTISPTFSLPAITEAVTIDGYTQPGASENTQATGGTDAVLKIELDGSGAGRFSVGLGILAPNSVIRGLVINRFDFAILIDERDNRVEGTFIGTDPSGTLDNLANLEGVLIFGSNNSIGGATPAARNLISGNNNFGVHITSGNKVEGNLIGVQRDGTSPLGNDGFGVSIASSNNTVGGGEAAAANVIAFNGADGVRVDDVATGNRILGNSIFSNDDLGIDLNGEGPTPNDPRDPDKGANNLQNFPQINSATRLSDGKLTVEGTLDSRPRKTFTIQFFSNPSGTDEGETFLGEITVKTNRKGNRSFSFTFTPAQPVTAGEKITATATNKATGDTSEFSSAVDVR